MFDPRIESHAGQKDRFVIFGEKAVKMGKKSWRETFETIGVKVPKALQVKILKIWPTVAPQKNWTQVLTRREYFASELYTSGA